jgi:hypothetical protein
VENDTEILWVKAVLGKQIEDFLSSDIGKYLLGKADKELANAIVALRDCSAEELLKYQSDMKRAESIRTWLVDAVEEGLRALNLIEELEEE